MKPSLRWPLVPASATLLLLVLVVPSASARNAYVANVGSESVSVIDTATNTASPTAIKVGKGPTGIAISPDGKTAYVANTGAESVSVIDTATNQASPTTIKVGPEPIAIAITPDGKTASVVNAEAESVSVIDTATNTASPTTIKVGALPVAIAISPDGKTAYVANRGDESVSVINTATNTASPTPIKVGTGPDGIAITPDGKTAYVANEGSESVSVIDTATNTASPTPIPVGTEPGGIAITPDGKTAYVANEGDESVSVIDTATNTANPTTIQVGRIPEGIAISPDGKTAYVANLGSGSVSVIDTATNTATPTAIAVGGNPFKIAITPDQAPTAAFSTRTARVRPGIPLILDASASNDSDGSIATHAWAFGDGQTATLSSPEATHAYAKPGSYKASLTLTDNEGCSASLIFTGQTASCAGSPLATMTIKVAYPGVKVRCPKTAKPRGCAFKLQVVGKRPKKGKKAKPESAVAKAKVKAGRSTIVSLKPTKAFGAKLAPAKQVLVRETVSANGSTRTRVVRLKIVQ